LDLKTGVYFYTAPFLFLGWPLRMFAEPGYAAIFLHLTMHFHCLRPRYFHWLILSFLCCQSANAQFRIVGYLNTWDSFPANASGIRFSSITHLNLAFAEPDAAGNLTLLPELDSVVDKAHDHQVKVLISVGGADLRGTKANWRHLTSPEHVQQFSDRVLGYLIKNNLDGIDIDLEGDVIGTHYGDFIKVLSSTLKPRGKLVTAAVATWFEKQIPSSCFPYFDFVNIMSYDSTGPWKPSHAGQHSSYSMAVNDLAFWKNKGLVKNKMGLGLPFYGYGFYTHSTADEYAYKDILLKYPGAENADRVGNAIYYNGISTIKEKTKLALREASGVMIWQLTEDAHDEKSLLSAINQVIKSSGK
jgi:chitinase